METADELLANAHLGIVGIDAAGNVFGGYDDTYPAASNDPAMAEERFATQLPAAERIALAEHMIERWTAYLRIAEASRA